MWTDDDITLVFAPKGFVSKPLTLNYSHEDNKCFVLMNDSKYTLGAVLMQKSGKDKIVAVQIASCSLDKSKRI